jgi:large-conductance mechanosensitive channel
MNIEYSTLIMNWINFFIILLILSFSIFIIVKIVKSLRHSKNTNELILKELKDISSKLSKKD